MCLCHALPFQVLSVATVKLGWAAVLLWFSPCLCLLTNTVIASQFVAEGSSTILLMIAQATDDAQLAASLRNLSFVMLLLPVFLPVRCIQ